jgi:hypothetical protein
MLMRVAKVLLKRFLGSPGGVHACVVSKLEELFNIEVVSRGERCVSNGRDREDVGVWTGMRGSKQAREVGKACAA